MNRVIQKDSRCNECKKLFCCKNCRDLHELKKHPRLKSDSDCDLCLSNILPLKINYEAKFICHLVIRHLPLICILCGNIYNTSLDLENFSKCDYWNKERSKLSSSLLSKAKKFPSPITRTVSCPSKSLRDSPISDTEYHSLQSFTSPPELMRNTSTPMQVGLSNLKTTPQLNKTPNFIFKTPITPTIKEKRKYFPDTINSLDSVSNIQIDPSPSSSLAFYSAKSQLINSNNNRTSLDNSLRNFSSGETPSRSILRNSRESFPNKNSERILEVMDEKEEQLETSMDITEVQDNIGAFKEKKFSSNANKEFEKKVRFSDPMPRPVADSTVDAVSILEEFYEAEDGTPEKGNTMVGNESEDQMIRDNKDNSDKENLDGRTEDSNKFKTPSSNNEDEGESDSPILSTASSSRVVMMVVVEKAFDIATRDLMPLINSSIRKLDRSNDILDNDDGNSTGSAVSGVTASVRLETKLQSNRSDVGGIVSKTVSSIDSYKSSSTVDYYLLSDKNDKERERSSDSTIDNQSTINNNDENVVAFNNGGIFSAVAKAMRSAFRALPGTGSARNPSPRSAEESINGSGSSGSFETSLNASGTFSTMTTTTTTTNSLSSRKRSRDPTNDSIPAVHRREPRSNGNENGASPVAKRPRSWHRIRGRDPIARMRREGSATRGVSSETQHFQQGSLSARDTIIPLPSRAHQSTQTD